MNKQQCYFPYVIEIIVTLVTRVKVMEVTGIDATALQSGTVTMHAMRYTAINWFQKTSADVRAYVFGIVVTIVTGGLGNESNKNLEA